MVCCPQERSDWYIIDASWDQDFTGFAASLELNTEHSWLGLYGLRISTKQEGYANSCSLSS